MLCEFSSIPLLLLFLNACLGEFFRHSIVFSGRRLRSHVAPYGLLRQNLILLDGRTCIPPALLLRYSTDAGSKAHHNIFQQVMLWGSSEFEALYGTKVFQPLPRLMTELEDKRPVSMSFGDGQIFATTSTQAITRVLRL